MEQSVQVLGNFHTQKYIRIDILGFQSVMLYKYQATVYLCKHIYVHTYVHTDATQLYAISCYNNYVCTYPILWYPFKTCIGGNNYDN